MDKRLLSFNNTDKERELFLVKEDRLWLSKHASGYHPKIQSYISNAKPIDNLIQVLITALGSWPYWPQNVNGDRFPLGALEHDGDDYGYKTFLTNANYFTHHVNKDPALAKGKVLAAVWNEKAKRVELIIGINPDLDPDAAAEISNGSNLAFSMGAKLPYDVCSICANKAKTRMEYCDHLRYQMNQIDPITGMLVGAINPQPKFFDISRVLIPADKTAYMWEKIAVGESPLAKLGSAEFAVMPAAKLFDDQYVTSKIAMKTEAWQEKKASNKVAAVKKKAAITKQIPADNVSPLFFKRLRAMSPVVKHALDQTSPDLDMGLLKGFSLAQIISTLLALAIIPKASESHELYRLFAPHSNLQPTAFGPHAFNPVLAKKLLPLVQERSFARPVLMRRLIILSARPQSELRKIAGEDKRDFHKGLAAGVLAAALAYSGQLSTLANLVAEHPFLAAALGIGVTRAYKTLAPDRPLVTGEVSVAREGNPLYNNDWQRRFVEAQAHPVTVIKTGADQKNLFEDLYGGIPFLFSLEGVDQHPATNFSELNPNILSYSTMVKESAVVGEDTAHLLSSARRFLKSASLENIEFLEGVPEASRNSVWDLAILNAADKIRRKS